MCLQALSALLWRPLAGHSFRPTWNSIHHNAARATMAAGIVAVQLGIHVAGVGWPYYILFAFLAGCFLIPAALLKPVSKKKVCCWPLCTCMMFLHRCNCVTCHMYKGKRRLILL